MNEFLMITLVSALMIISPGPDFAVVVKNSIARGRRGGIYASLGVAIANFCHVALNLLGIGMIIARSMIAFTAMKILGAGYLLYLGYKGLRAKPLQKKISVSNRMVSKRDHQSFYNGLLTSLLNPKAWLFYLSFFSVVVSPAARIQARLLYGIWLSGMALGWFVLVSFFFTSPVISEKTGSFKQGLERLTGGVLFLLGIKLLTSEISR